MSPPAADTPPDDINGIDEIDDPLEMSSASPLRERAEAVLRELVGRGDARLRDDQWSAIRALVVVPAVAVYALMRMNDWI